MPSDKHRSADFISQFYTRKQLYAEELSSLETALENGGSDWSSGAAGDERLEGFVEVSGLERFETASLLYFISNKRKA